MKKNTPTLALVFALLISMQCIVARSQSTEGDCIQVVHSRSEYYYKFKSRYTSNITHQEISRHQDAAIKSLEVSYCFHSKTDWNLVAGYSFLKGEGYGENFMIYDGDCMGHSFRSGVRYVSSSNRFIAFMTNFYADYARLKTPDMNPYIVKYETPYVLEGLWNSLAFRNQIGMTIQFKKIPIRVFITLENGFLWSEMSSFKINGERRDERIEASSIGYLLGLNFGLGYVL